MKHEEAISEVLRLLDDNKKRQFPFLTEKEESAVRATLEGFEAAERDLILAVSGHRCDICVNDECHYSDDEEIVACSAGIFKWRGPCAENRRKEE